MSLQSPSDGRAPSNLPQSENLRNPRLLVAIVNYRTAELTVACLSSLEAQARAANVRVLVADNASGDGSYEVIAGAIRDRGWSDWASSLALPVNGGFASGNNAIVRAARERGEWFDYLLLLNPDTIVFPGALNELVRFATQHPKAGIVGGHQQAPDGTALCSSFGFPVPASELCNGLRFGPVSRLLSKWQTAGPIPETPTRCDWVSGGCMLISTAVLDAIGLLDEGYFLYFEETDFCLRAARAGFECWFVPDARIMHIGGQSTGVTGIHRKVTRMPQYWFDSRRRYFLKNHGVLFSSAVDGLYIAGYCAFRARAVVQPHINHDPPEMLADYWCNSVFVRGFSLNAKENGKA
jgi:N-acetylglucosaminyl-diphospho-decaprenol L-rhamnosyltransferase